MSGFLRQLPRLAACLLLALCALPAGAADTPAARHKAARHPAQTPTQNPPPHPQNAAKAAKPAEPPIRIGEINSYKLRPDLLIPYRNGWQMAQDEINSQGGVLGRKLQVIWRDDDGTDIGAVAAAKLLADQDQVSLFFGGLTSEAGQALADYAGMNKAFYLATLPMSPRITWEQGNAYTYRLVPSGWMQMAALVPRTFGLRKRRWAMVYPDSIYGRSTAATFRDMITHFQSRTSIVSDQRVAPGKFDARALVHQLQQDKPDAIFTPLTGQDLVRFIHESKAAGLLQDTPVVAPLAGEPEALQAMGSDAGPGWLVSGYPCVPSNAAADMQRFEQDYQARYGAAPGSASALGYIALRFIAAGLRKAGSADPQAVAAAFSGLRSDTPYGSVLFRPIDHQATMGVCLAVTAEQDGHIVAQPTGYLDGLRLQPPDMDVHKLRGKQQ